MNIATLAKVS